MTAKRHLGRMVVLSLGTALGCRARPVDLGGWGSLPRVTALPGDARVFTGGAGNATNVVGLDFGQVVVGPCRHQTIQLWNQGREDLVLTSVDLGTSGQVFEIAATAGMRVASGGAPLDLPILFCPRQEGFQNTRILLGTNSRAVPILTVNMEGVAQVTVEGIQVRPTELDFGAVLTNSSSTLSVQVTNPGWGTVFLCPQPPQGPGATVFSVPRSITLGPQQSTPLPVTLIPTGQLPLAASFDIRLGTDASCRSFVDCEDCGARVGLLARPQDSWLAIEPADHQVLFGYARQIDGTGSAGPTFITVTMPIRATNIGLSPVAFYGVQIDPPDGGPNPFDAGPFTVGPIAPGATKTIDLYFTPPSLGLFRGTLHLQTNDQRTQPINLVGTGGGPIIQCSASVLDFGPTTLGVTNAQQKTLTCTNLGPADLTFTASGPQLPTSDPAFSAWFAAPTQGLKQFQSAPITVAFNPTVQGVTSATLTIASDDPQQPNLQVGLTGTGVVASPCTLGIVPNGPLDFGKVLDPPYAFKTLTVTNLGPTDCTLTNFATDTTAFRVLAAESIDPLVLAPGASQDLNVQFAPPRVGPARSYLGDLSFYAAGASPPNQTIQLLGTAGAACLHLSPNPLDLGLVGFDAAAAAWCASPPQTVTVTNECALSIHVQSVSALTSPDFTVSGLGGSGPWAVAIGQPFTFQVSYTPLKVGPTGPEILQLVTDDPQGLYPLPMLGVAELPNNQIDTFAGHARQVDVLWVVDTDDDAATQQQLISGLDGFLAQARAQAIDFQMGVTAMSYGGLGQKLGAPSDDGWLEPCAHCISQGAPAANLITPNTLPDPSVVLGQVLNLGAPLSDTMRQELSANQADEQFFETVLDALQPPLLAQHNQGFLRPNASLAVLAVNGDSSEDDESPGSIDSYYNFVLSSLPSQSPNVFSFSYLRNESYGLSPPKGSRLAQLVARTGGQDIDLTQSSWPTALNQVWVHFLDEYVRYPLSAQPADPNPFDAALHPNGVRLTINGGALVPPVNQFGAPQWRYDLRSNSVIFDPSAVPAAGDAIAVTYAVGCGP